MSIENDILAQSAEQLQLLVPPQPEAAELTVRCCPDDFLASAIARAVEDCNAHLINLNVTGTRGANGELLVHLRINRRNVEPVSRSLERRGYQVVEGADSADDSKYDLILADRANQLLHILNL